MKTWKRGQLMVLMIGICAIGYWLILKLMYGGISFAPVFLLGGLCLVVYACLMHHVQVTLSSILPVWVYRCLLGFFIVAVSIFAIVEAQIIYHANHESHDSGDVILVLGAGLINGDQISSSLQYRLERALTEHEKDPTTPIIVSGGQGLDETVSEAYAMKQWLLQHGVDEDIVWMEDRSTTTSENFTFSMELMKKRGITSQHITLISNAFHMHRAKYLGELYGLEISCKPAKELQFAQLCFYTREFFGTMRAYLMHR